MNASAELVPWRTGQWAKDRVLVESGGSFIHDLAAWRWFATLTFTASVPRDVAMRSLRTWLRGLASNVMGDHIRFACAIDVQSGGRLHMHALLAWERVVDIATEVGEREWHSIPLAGHSRIAAYDAARGAAMYLASHAEWDVNVACPRRSGCRKRGCSVAPSPW